MHNFYFLYLTTQLHLLSASISLFLPLISLIAFLLGLTYLLLIRFYLREWEKLPIWQLPASFMPTTSVSILIPARNEATRIRNCLEHIRRQNYPPDLLEILVIDDHSSDGTGALVRSLNDPLIHIFSLPEGEEGKKAALAYGIHRSAGKLIITTDADCLVPEQWLSYLVSYYEAHNPVFITAPVNFFAERSALERFQSLDILGTMILTGAGIQSGTLHMSNGANLAYPKTIFEAVGGFTGIDYLASGDDMLLMHKIVQTYPGRLAFLKQPQASVHTSAVSSWRAFFQQRLRWATKSGTYQDWRIIATLSLVFFLCWGILLSPLLVFFWGLSGLLPFLLLLTFKMVADYQLLGRAARFFNRRELMRYFWTSQLFHIIYIALIGLTANLVKQYTWKGRRVQ
ncbi:MAG: glycosyltransferase [Saprospiraceae bacterium]|nr:glycosyltransferase [Lewinella sp.]